LATAGRAKEHDNGEYGLNKVDRDLQHLHNLITFVGKDRVEVTRRALDYWYRTLRGPGITLKEFLRHCRLSADGTTIIFQAA
jgi:hypothetical protein